MNKVLVTGAGGFIGKALCKKLHGLGYEVIALTSDQGDIADKNIFAGYKSSGIKHAFHLASKNFVPDSWENPSAFYHTNVMGTLNVLEFCRVNSISLTYVSAYLYGIPEKLPISENEKIKPNNPYAHTKHLAEQLCEFYSREFNLNVTVIRPFNVYGPGQRDVFLIPTIIKQARKKKSIHVLDLFPKRDYIYIDDVVNALILTISHTKNFSVFNIGSGTSISVKEIIELIQKILKTDKPVTSENKVRENEISEVIADISLAGKTLKWKPEISLSEGISRTIN